MQGHKSVDSLLSQNKFEIEQIYATQSWIDHNSPQAHRDKVHIVDIGELKKLSEHKSPPEVMASVHITPNTIQLKHITKSIYLDDVQDPGNVGTIIRIADWYGIKTIIRSAGSADFYNPKVIQSTMGSFANLDLVTISKAEVLASERRVPLISAGMTGIPIDEVQYMNEFMLIMGSEGQGISDSIRDQVDFSITIPGVKGRIAESLNVSVAAGILCQKLLGQT